MASEAEFLQDLQPPDIEEVKVVSSSKANSGVSENVIYSNESKPQRRHSAEKLDENKILQTIDLVFGKQQHNGKVCKTMKKFNCSA